MSLKNFSWALGLACLGVFSQANSARALSWNWSYSGTDASGATVNASGTLVTDGTTYDSTGNTVYTIQSISGERDGVQISGLTIQNTTYSAYGNTYPEYTYSSGIYLYYDQVFTWDGTNIQLDGAGIGYDLANNDKVNIFCSSCTTNFASSLEEHLYNSSNGGTVFNGSSSFSMTSVMIPFEFSQSLGVTLGIPFFLGFHLLKKRLTRKSTIINVTEII